MTVFLCLIQGFLSLFALLRLMQVSTSNPLSLILFAALTFIYFQFTKNQVECRIQPCDKVYSTILGLFFTIITLFAKHSILVLNSDFAVERAVILTITGIGLFLIYYYTLLWLFITCGEVDINKNLYPSTLLPVITFLGSLLVFGIYYIIEYPGILPAKTQSQFLEIHGVMPFSDNVSLVHTTLLDKIYKLLYLITRNDDFGIAGLTLLQIMVVSFVASYIVKTLQKAHINSKFCILVVIYYLLPYHGLMAVTLSANTLFAVNLAGYVAVLIRIFLKPDQRSYTKPKWFSIIVPYFIFGLMICTLSKNGFIVFVLSLPFILITLKEKWRATISTSAVILLLVAFINYPFMKIYDIERIPLSKSISPLLKEIFSGNSGIPTLTLVKSFLNESLPIIYPLGNFMDLSKEAASSGLLNVPEYFSQTVFSMQSCIPLYGLMFGSGIVFWVTLTSLFLCIKNERIENIPLILPALIFSISLVIMPPEALIFSEVFPLFYICPLILFIPFIDSESEF